jgi:TRAP transporter TAXI family solute receptor
MKKKSLLLMMMLTFALLLAACGQGGDGGGGADPSDVTILTGGEQGVYFPLGGALGDIINNHVEGLSATPVTSGASVRNVNDLNDGMGELALVQNDIAYYAAEGLNMFEERITGFSGVATLYPEVVQIVTAADSGIQTVEDLRGKRIAVGDQGSGTEANARQILEAYGITYDDVQVEYMAFGDAANQIQDDNIDAAFITSGTPAAAIEALKAVRDIALVSISQDVVNQLIETYPYYTAHTIPSDVYDTADDALTVAVQAMLIVSNDLSEDLVYNITKAMFENLDVFVNTHSRGADITLETALDGMSINLHPGAQRYFDEVQ